MKPTTVMMGALLCALALPACELIDRLRGVEPEEGDEAPEGDARDTESLKVEIVADTSELAKEKEALLEKRKEIETEMAALDDARDKLVASASDPDAKGKKKADALASELTALLERERALRAKEATYRAEVDALDERKDKVLAKVADGLAAAGDGPKGAKGAGAGAGAAGGGGGGGTGGGGAAADDLRSREKKMADREADLARREKSLAEREASVAEREAKLAGGVMPMVTRIEVPAGTTYTKKHVDASYAKAKTLMRKKGILESDLPPGADGLGEQIEAAIAKSDWTTAKVIADTLGDTVERIKIDRAFVSAKIARLNSHLTKKGIKPDDGTIWPKFTSATKDFTDGKFGAANTTINSIYASLK